MDADGVGAVEAVGYGVVEVGSQLRGAVKKVGVAV